MASAPPEASRRLRVLRRREVPGLATLYLARLRGDPALQVEFVDTLEPGVPKARKWVLMVSTQFGCPVGCLMCDAGTLGYQGNLAAEEILEQVRHVFAANPDLDPRTHPKIKIHFARMGEPSLNPGVLEALEGLAREWPGRGLLPSLSSVAPRSPAVAPFFERLLELKNARFPDGRFQLQFSIHSTDDARRRELIPVKTWPLEEIAAYGLRFVAPGDRKITLNFALPPGERLDCARLAGVFPADRFLIKITPVNPTGSARRTGTLNLWDQAPEPVSADAARLRELGFAVIVSPSLPEELDSATSCGQLWSDALQEQALVMDRNRARERDSYVDSRTLPARARAWSEQLAPFRREGFPLDPSRAALMVIDLQQFFLDPRSPAYRPASRAILGNARALVDAFREAGRPVFFIRHAHKDPSRDAGLMAGWWRKVCLEGSRWAEVSPLLAPRPEETRLKRRYSAFSERALRRDLRARGVAELVMAGLMTNLCVESTARDAFDEGFKPFVVLDATAAHSEELHLAALKNLAFGFAGIRSTQEVLKAMLEQRAGISVASS